jgi:hypothetical protein
VVVEDVCAVKDDASQLGGENQHQERRRSDRLKGEIIMTMLEKTKIMAKKGT